MCISNLTAAYQLIWFLTSYLWIPKQLFTALRIPEAFFPPCKYQNSYSMTGESLTCVELLRCALSKDIMCFSLWMRTRKWDVELPEVCLQTWKEGGEVLRATGCDQKSSFVPCAPRRESVKCSAWQRCRSQVEDSFFIPAARSPLWAANACAVSTAAEGFFTVLIPFGAFVCSPRCSSRFVPHPRRMRGSSSSPSHCSDSRSSLLKFAFLALTPVQVAADTHRVF